MKEITLVRATSGEKGTFGLLIMDGEVIAQTCEDPWNGNKVGQSCIPNGKYTVVPHNPESKSWFKYKDVWRVKNVKGRTAILIHAGNTKLDTRGCILVGNGFGKYRGLPAIFNSRNTVRKLRKVLPDTFRLIIKTA